MANYTFFATRLHVAELLSALLHLGSVLVLPSLGEPEPVVTVDHVIPVVAAVSGMVSAITVLSSLCPQGDR